MTTFAPPVEDARAEPPRERPETPRAPRPGHDGPPLGAAWRRVAGRARTLLVAAVVGGLAAGAVRVAMPRTYTSSASFVPQARTAPSGLSGLAAQFGVAIAAGEPAQSPPFYVSLLQSQLLRRRAVDTTYEFRSADGQLVRGTLVELLRAKGATPARRREDAIRRLDEAMSENVNQRTGIISLTVKTRHAALSQQVAQRLVALVDDFNRRQRQSQAAAERRFTEARLATVAAELRDAEARLERFYASNRVADAPHLMTTAERLRRDVDLRQQVYVTLSQSLERAKIDEVRDTPVITLIDPPSLPARADPRGLGRWGVLGAILGVVLAAAWIARRELAAVGRAIVR